MRKWALTILPERGEDRVRHDAQGRRPAHRGERPDDEALRRNGAPRASSGKRPRPLIATTKAMPPGSPARRQPVIANRSRIPIHVPPRRALTASVPIGPRRQEGRLGAPGAARRVPAGAPRRGRPTRPGVAGSRPAPPRAGPPGSRGRRRGRSRRARPPRRAPRARPSPGPSRLLLLPLHRRPLVESAQQPRDHGPRRRLLGPRRRAPATPARTRRAREPHPSVCHPHAPIHGPPQGAVRRSGRPARRRRSASTSAARVAGSPRTAHGRGGP